MAKLWDKGYDIDDFFERFTVGEDYLLDRDLIVHDCVGSAAQAVTLERAGILTPEESKALIQSLKAIMRRANRGEFSIEPSQEDVHTAVENALTEELGEAGKKIHAGRSRNDQVIVDLRLFGREALIETAGSLKVLVDSLSGLAERHGSVPVVGRTHTQKAMPSSVGLWCGAYMEAVEEDLDAATGLYRLLNRCPLGSGASYGSALPLDREYTAHVLGFERPVINVLHANHGRGRTEAAYLGWACQVALTLSRMAQDLILWSLPEFGYVTLPAELCSGSSLMPQKRNPCGLELVRAKTAAIFGYHNQVLNIVRALPSGYSRDLQETKAPFMRAVALLRDCVLAVAQVVGRMEVHEEAMLAAFTPEVFATDEALDKVSAGTPFRDAYLHVGTHLDDLDSRDPHEEIQKRTMLGSTGNLQNERILDRVGRHMAFFTDAQDLISGAIGGLLGVRYPQGLEGKS